MDYRGFYEAVLPNGDGFRFFLWRKTGAFTQIVDGFDGFLSAAHNAAAGVDMYYATAAYADGAPARKNVNVRAIKALRLDLDAGPDKFDPANPSKAYATQRDALSGLIRFTETTRLAPSFIVSSGYGLHVYYAFEEATTDLDAWDAAAANLGQLCTQHGLLADPAVTTDRGRLLRVIGSQHSVAGSAVRILRDTGARHPFTTLAEKIASQLPQPAAAPAGLPVDGRNASLAAKLAEEAGLGPPTYFSSYKKAALECEALREALHNEVRLEYPQWLCVIRTADHSVEGRALAHEISRANAEAFGGRYNAAEVEAKLEDFESDIVRCTTFAQSRPKCRACPHFGKINGPKELGKLTAKDPGAAELPAPKAELPSGDALARIRAILPADFPAPEEIGQQYGFVPIKQHGGDNLQLYRVVREDSDDGVIMRKVPVCTTPFYVAQRVGAVSGRDAMYTVRVFDPDHRVWHAHPFPADVTSQRDKLLEYTAKLGIVRCDASPQNGQFLHQYVMNLLQAIQRKPSAPAARDGFGFQFDAGGRPIYVHGQVAITHDGHLSPAIVPAKLGGVYIEALRVPALNGSSDYSESDWDKLRAAAQRHAAALRRAYDGAPHYQMVLAMGLGSILMPFLQDRGFVADGSLPMGGAVLTLYSETSGVGKSTLHDMATSWFYDANGLKIGGSGRTGGSVKARIARAADLGHLPNVQDELTNAEPEVMSELLYSLGNGQDTARLDNKGVMQVRRTFSSIGMVSTNISQRSLMTSYRPTASAEQMRVMEVNFDQLPKSKLPASMRKIGAAKWGVFFNDHIAPNIGAAGLLLAREVMKMGFDRTFRAAVGVRERLDERLKLTQQERFFSRMGASMLLAITLLRRAGVETFNEAEVYEAFAECVEKSRAYLRQHSMTVDQLWCDMITEISEELIFTESERHAKAGGEVPLHMPRNRVSGRYVQSLGLCYVSSKRADEWCRKRGLQVNRMIEVGLEHGWVVPAGVGENGQPIPFHDKHNITKGVLDQPILRTRVVALNLEKLFPEDAAIDEDGKVVYLTVPKKASEDQSVSPNSSAS